MTVVPIKSQTGAITSTLGKLLWAIQAWYSEMENDERAEAIKAGQARARAGGNHFGRPKRIFNRERVTELRRKGASIRQIAKQIGLGLEQSRGCSTRIQGLSKRFFSGLSGARMVARGEAQ